MAWRAAGARERYIIAALSYAGIALGVIAYLAWELAHRGVYAYSTAAYPFDDADEWRYTACSRLVLHGYALFDQVFSAQPPLLFLSLASSMRVFGSGIDGARGVEILLGVVGLIAAAWIAWWAAGPVAGAAAALLLAASPGYLVYSHMVEAEGPMMALGTLSLALLTRLRRSPNDSIWAAMAGACLAAAILMKLFAVQLLLPGIWLILSSMVHPDQRSGSPLSLRLCAPHTPNDDPPPESNSPFAWLRIAIESPLTHLLPLLTYLGVTIGIVGLDFALVSPLHQWQQVIRLHNAAASVSLPFMTPSSEIFRRFFLLDPGLTALAIAGILAIAFLERCPIIVDRSARQAERPEGTREPVPTKSTGPRSRRIAPGRWRLLIFLLLWLPGAAVMLLLFRPLFPHHAAILLTSMGVCGGIACGVAFNALRARQRPILIAVGVALLVYALSLPHLARADRTTLYRSVTASDILGSFVAGHTPPSAFVVVDDLHTAEAAHRLVPPQLCDPSYVRFAAGYLTPATAIDSTRAFHAQLVLATGVLSSMPAYQRWLKAHFAALPAPFRLTAYVRR